MVCGLPSNVLLLSVRYWPIVGSSLALVNREGRIALVVPQDEREFAVQSAATEMESFEPASLDDLHVAEDVVWKALAKAAKAIGVSGGRFGRELAASVEPVSYASVHRFKMSLTEIVSRIPGCTIADASGMLAELRSVCTPAEIQCLRRSCQVAGDAFQIAGRQLRPGISEVSVATEARVPLHLAANGRDPQHLAVMSGERSATAFGSFAISSNRQLAPGELAMLHCNSNVNGYWTDVTRTFCLGPPTPLQRRMFDAVLAAREAGLPAIHPGTRAADVDRAARQTLAANGFADEFKHATGHGVGFAAIDHNALPRLHPKSPDLLKAGMVFNVEPAVYLHNQGLRHCGMVVVTVPRWKC